MLLFQRMLRVTGGAPAPRQALVDDVVAEVEALDHEPSVMRALRRFKQRETLRIAYGTSKAAVIQLTLQQAVELGEHGVRANCVAPGPVRTKLAMAVHSPEIIAAYHDALPLNRYGSEKEIAEAIVFLCSERASFITGQVLAADGGFEATGIGLPALRK
jgi:NAD(P)-dependent dehydrogenase (short-subunit alcohol dehydrogenase family)